jgi:hypothetical protein
VSRSRSTGDSTKPCRWLSMRRRPTYPGQGWPPCPGSLGRCLRSR